jgi:hypothetical protein
MPGFHMSVDRRGFLKAVGCAAISRRVVCAESSGGPVETRLRNLADWIARSFRSEPIGLVPNMPSGRTRNGRQRDDLKNLYWLQNCNLYAMFALRPYRPELARRIEESYRRWYAKAFPDVVERTAHYLTVGKLPAIDVREGRYLRAVVRVKEYGGFRVGTETNEPDRLGEIRPDNPKTLLKDGVLHAVLKGKRKLALDYFDQAMSLFDGSGFAEKRTEAGRYHTRNLAYALIAERALRIRMPERIRGVVEERLWSGQDTDGGIWTDYCADGTIPPFAKKTNEIAPLTLLAYDKSLWQ